VRTWSSHEKPPIAYVRETKMATDGIPFHIYTQQFPGYHLGLMSKLDVHSLIRLGAGMEGIQSSR
jgi:hypothetical protein